MTNSATHQDLPPLDRALITISKIASALLGLTFFAYLIGWNFMSAYLDEFGAEWLITETPPLVLLKHTQWIIYVVSPFVVISMVRLSSTSMEGIFGKKWRTRILSYGPMVPLTLFGIKAMLKKWFPETLFQLPMPLLPFLESGTILILFIAVFEEFVIQLRSRRHQLEIRSVSEKRQFAVVMFAIVMVMWGFGSIPGSFGRSQAKTDKDPSRSTLPVIKIKNGNDANLAELRLLLIANDRFFSISLDGEHYPVAVLTPAGIVSIEKQPRKKK